MVYLLVNTEVIRQLDMKPIVVPFQLNYSVLCYSILLKKRQDCLIEMGRLIISKKKLQINKQGKG